MKYLNFTVEMCLMFFLGYFLSFSINPNSTVFLKNYLGERLVGDGVVVRIVIGAVTAPSILLICYCAFADAFED
jgi:uncharacterized membrane protein (DUF485 family)